MAFVLWITGLPGSGKSTIAKKVKELCKEEIEILRLDEIRDELRAELESPPEKYSPEERELIYSKIVDKAKELFDAGTNVIIDATAHKRAWRDKARELIPNFKEVYIKCDVKTAMQREGERKDDLVVKDLYKKALAGKEGIGQLPGVNVEYEEPLNPELIIKSEHIKPREAAQKIIEIL